jgi:hypothetical protein
MVRACYSARMKKRRARPTRTTGRFEGVSKEAKFVDGMEEALADALFKAKNALKSDRVQFSIVRISGAEGGLVSDRVSRVVVQAKTPK